MATNTNIPVGGDAHDPNTRELYDVTMGLVDPSLKSHICNDPASFHSMPDKTDSFESHQHFLEYLGACAYQDHLQEVKGEHQQREHQEETEKQQELQKTEHLFDDSQSS